MRTIQDPRQGRLVDVFSGVIGDVGRRLMATGWQGVFRHVVLQELPALRLGADLDEFLGRPSAELHAMCGLLLLREFYDWTVPEAHEALLFRSDVQYALNLQPGFEVSQRTIERYLARLQKSDDLANDVFLRVTNCLVQHLDLNVTRQRLDSTHVFSDMATFGRTRMLGVAIRRFLVQVRKRQPAAYAAIPEDFRTRYERTGGKLFGATQTTEERERKRQQAAEDLYDVVRRFAEDAVIAQWPIYQQLVLMFHQQCELIEERVTVRKQTGGDVLQNPSDPDATYSGRKGEGYQLQLVETCHPDNEQQLILAALPQTAVEHDAQTVVPLLTDLQERGHLPEQLSCDCAYGSDANVQAASALGTKLVSPVPGGAKFDPQSLGPEHFTWDPVTQTITACPAGHAPLSSTYNSASDRVVVTMSLGHCTGCPLLERCPIQLKAQSAKLYFEMSEHRSGERRQAEQTADFRANYAPRAGIESLNSSLKRRLGLGQLRVRGKPAVWSALLLKVTGWNILRASQTTKLRALVLQQLAQAG